MATVAPIPVDVLVVFAVVLLALILFTTERIPVDLTAITVMVLLIALEPWTEISVQEGISGFSNPATVTVLAMLILSVGVSRTGIVQRLGGWMADVAGDSPHRQLAATIGIAGPASGFVNNTPVVAILVPVIVDLAHKGKTSPSKLLMPLSFASMFGGMLTLIGTSTNILASDISRRLIGHPFSMFEFTGLGLIILVVGSVYLMTVGYWLLPERILPEEDYVEEYALDEYLAEVIVRPDSPLIGETLETALSATDVDVDVIEVERDDERFIGPLGRLTIHEDDVFIVRTDRQTLETLVETEGLAVGKETVGDEELEAAEPVQTLVEVVVPSGSELVGETLASAAFRQRFDANVLAIRSHGRVRRERLDKIPIRIGDTLLVQAPSEEIDRLSRNRDFIVAHEPEQPEYRTEKIPYAIAIMIGVVGVAALDILPIVVSALAGVVAMAVFGVLKPHELYESVDWNVIFLLAGVIPLGIALEQTGGAAIIGDLVAATGTVLPALGVLWVFYFGTALVTNVISNTASVVLMIPVAVEAAAELNLDPFAFVLAVTFAASTAFMTPVGYQTNLFVYGAGGYRFSDYLRVGAPLQLLLSIVTVLGIAAFWGLAP